MILASNFGGLNHVRMANLNAASVVKGSQLSGEDRKHQPGFAKERSLRRNRELTTMPP